MNQRAIPFIGEIKRTLHIVTFLAFAFVSNSFADTFKLSDTGQTACYDTAGVQIPCAGTGQDGAYIINPMSYTDNGNGTVSDNNTGLIWQKDDDNNTYNWYQASGTYDALSNPNSQNVCGSLGADWRLPTKKELLSIVDYSIPYPGPTINTTYFPNTQTTWPHWSSTTSTCYYPDYAWQVFFNSGDVASINPKGGPAYVKCVRNEQLDFGHFMDNQDGTVTDSATDLTWQQSEPGNMAWESAVNYCEGLSLGNKSDWRLPNIKELASIIDDALVNPAIDTGFFPNAYAAYYWSSTTDASHPAWAWLAAFHGTIPTSVGHTDKQDPGNYNVYVRCVRGGQTAPPADQFFWPVAPQNQSDGHYGSCRDWPGDPAGCYWLNDEEQSLKVWRDVQPFQQHEYKTLWKDYGWHLGADYNLGSDSNDKGKEIYPTSTGEIPAGGVLASVPCWGNVVFVRHETSFGTYTSMYAHVKWINNEPPAEGSVSPDKPLALVGNGIEGVSRSCPKPYPYHLHFEIREEESLNVGPGYTPTQLPTGEKGPQGQIDPNAFISNHR